MSTPLYGGQHVDPAYQLRYSWCGWLARSYARSAGWDVVLARTARTWETDGLRLLEATSDNDSIQLLFSALPYVSPVTIAVRAKGRLQHTAKQLGQACNFSRKLSVRSIGDNTTSQVERYIRAQVAKEDFVDPRLVDTLDQFTVIDNTVDLSKPTASRSGRYWYNLHIVLVMRQRGNVVDEYCLRNIRDTSLAVANKKEYRIAALSLMPDHLHMALRGHIQHSPQEIVLAFQNSTAWRLGAKAIWQDSYYVGTFSEYDMNAIRRRVLARQTNSSR